MIGQLIQGIGRIYAGYSAYKSAFGEASLLEEQGSLTRDDYFKQAALIKDSGERLRAKQTMDYVSAGVEVVGTPLLVLKETLSRSYARASSYETTGGNYQALYNRKAKIMRSEGRAALISGILQGTGMAVGGIESAAMMAGGAI